MKKRIYLDNAAATPTDSRVVRAMTKALRMTGNPSAFHAAGREARRAIDEARATIGQFLNAHPNEIVFCSSGSEANTLALLGVADACDRPGRLILSAVEHHSVLAQKEQLIRKGWNVVIVPCDAEGRIDPEAIKKALTPDTKLISLQYANNEIGTIQPIQRIGKIVAQWRRETGHAYPYFHVDACQAAVYLPMNVQGLGVDLLSLNGAKIYGPKGAAALFVRRGVSIKPIIHGGKQEQGLRAGTENVAGIIGLATAVALIDPAKASRVAECRDVLLKELQELEGIRINGPLGDDRLPNNVHVSVRGCTSERLLLELDRHGVIAGSGSACTAHSVEPSHVLRAIGAPKAYLDGALRLTLSHQTTKQDVRVAAKAIAAAIDKVRSLAKTKGMV